jgi:nucleoside-diphosphate-sugar epimerase
VSAKEKALVIGGTGPTGPWIVEGLAERGYDVTILHGGQHEVEFAVPVKHIHEDPHFVEGLERGIGEDTYDLVVAGYGRLRIISDFMKGRTGRLIALGSATGLYARPSDPRWGIGGRPAFLPDTTTIFENAPDENKIAFRVVEAMQQLLEHHAAGSYSATYVGWPLNYGPRQPGPQDWITIRRILDGRRRIVIADGGVKMESRVYTENAAAAVLLVVDNPEVSAGKRYSVTDENTYTMRQRVEMVAQCMGAELELFDMPYDVAWPAHPLWRREQGHRLCQSGLIRAELGYRDAVSTTDAIQRTVKWLLENPLERGGEAETQIGDPFDYEAEDALIARWEASREALGAIDSPLVGGQPHQYRHPKKLGEAWSAGPATGGASHG